MSTLPRRRSKSKPPLRPVPAAASPGLLPAAPPSPTAPTAPTAPTPPAAGPRLAPVDELDARLREPEEGAFLHGLEQQVTYYPTLVEQIGIAGKRIVEALHEHDSPALWSWYEELEGDYDLIRERAAFGLGWQHGSADGRAEAFRTHAPGLAKRARRLADQARALVVNGGLSPVDATALLLETAWAVVLTKAAPAYEG